jgi:hypothetical protein
MVALARCLCTDKARSWAEIQPLDQTWEQFKASFMKEWGERNLEKLYFEMLNHFQNESSEGEYATVMSRYFSQLRIPPEKQIEYFIKKLCLGSKESTFARHPITLADAMDVVREAENLYFTLTDKREEPGTEIKEIEKQVEMLTLQKAAVSPVPSTFPAGRPMRCPKCLQEGHAIPRFCNNEPKTHFNPCCNYWGRHRPDCAAARGQQPTVPTNHNNTGPPQRPQNRAANIMEEVFPTDTAAAEPIGPAEEAFAGEPSSDSASEEESAYSSSEDTASDSDDEEMFAGKRGRNGDQAGGNPSNKAQKRNKKEPSKTKENKKPVKNPLSKD